MSIKILNNTIEPAKKKHFSRKLKSTWRKHIDLKDVETFLDETREDERVVGDLTSKTDNQLFSIDTKPDPNLNHLTYKQKRKLKASEPAVCFAALESTSQVKDPIIKRNRVKTKEERKHPLRKQKEANKCLKAVNENVGQQKKKQKTYDFGKDIWNEEEVPKDFQVEWYSKNLIEHNLKNLGKAKVKAPGEVHSKRSALKAITQPHPGISYNPTFDDHKELTDQIISKETDIIKRKEHIERVVTKKFIKLSPSEVEKIRQMELVEGFPIDPNSKKGGDESEVSDNEGTTGTNPPALNKKKDRRQRRKQQEAKKRMALEKQKKQELNKIKDIVKVPILKKEIMTQEKKLEKQRKNQEIRQKEKQFSAGRINKRRYREPEEAVNPIEDISGNMRSLKPEGNLLLERFKSLQKRNILPSGMLRKPRRRKTMVKKYVKQSHKGEGIHTKSKIKAPKNYRRF